MSSYQTAGGDSGLYIDGMKSADIENNTFVGNRDCSLYTSANLTGAAGSNFRLSHNNFYNSIIGLCVKRGVIGFDVEDNIFYNAITAISVNYIVANSQGGRIANNVGFATNQLVFAENAVNLVIEGNVSNNAGALLADGATIFPYLNPYVVDLEGVTNGIVQHNAGNTPNAGLITVFPGGLVAFNITTSSAAAGSVTAAGNTLFGNRMNGWRVLGASTCVNCLMLENMGINGSTSNFFTSYGTGSQAVEYDVVNGIGQFRTQVAFDDGSVSAPTISRRGSANSGIYFSTGGVVNVAVAGSQRLAATTSGVSIGGLLTLTPGTPAHNTAACTAGQISTDAAYLYYCKTTNSWDRVAWPGATW